MSTSSEQLVVRQHERFVCRLPADLSLDPDSPTRVSLSRSVGDGTGVAAATIVDCSGGGVGVEVGVYLPRQSRVHVRIASDEPAAPGLELEATVQRANMISRAPRYYLGLSFRGKNPPSAATIDRLIKQAARAARSDPAPAAAPAKPGVAA